MRRNIDPAHRCMKVNCWPLADREAWVAASRKGSVVRPGGTASRWAATTMQTMLESYGRWLTWLQCQNLFDPDGVVLQKVMSENVVRYVQDLASINASSTIVNRVRCLFFMANAMAPNQDWEWLRTVWYNLQKVSVPARNKRARLVEAEDLLALGIELMATAERDDGGSLFKRAVVYRDGFILAVLAARSLRLRNFAGLKIGQHLVKVGANYWLVLAASETKTRQPLDWPYPNGLRPHLERYLSFYRPLLFPRNRGSKQPFTHNPVECRGLWVSIQGTAMAAGTIYARIIARTRAKFGRSVNPHLFRDAAATAIAMHDPEHVQIVMPLLGHSNLKTGQRVYDQSRSMEASRRHQALVESLRRRSRDDSVHGRSSVGTNGGIDEQVGRSNCHSGNTQARGTAADHHGRAVRHRKGFPHHDPASDQGGHLPGADRSGKRIHFRPQGRVPCPGHRDGSRNS